MSQLAIITAAAQSYGTAFLLAGGHAVIAHGFARSTFDIDLIARHTDREKWLQLARSVGYELYHEDPNFLQFNAADEGTFPLDLMFVSDATFAKMQAAAAPAPSGLEGLRVVSLMHLLALKCHAVKFGHAGRIVKDAEDVKQLLLRNRLDPNSRTFVTSSKDTALMNFMKKSEGLARPTESTEFDLPDWSRMDDSSARITPEAAFRLCELYPQLLAHACKGNPEPRFKESLPEFVL